MGTKHTAAATLRSMHPQPRPAQGQIWLGFLCSHLPAPPSSLPHCASRVINAYWHAANKCAQRAASCELRVDCVGCCWELMEILFSCKFLNCIYDSNIVYKYIYVCACVCVWHILATHWHSLFALSKYLPAFRVRITKDFCALDK